MARGKCRERNGVTLRDVATHAGVSPKTVSNVINNWPYVTPETRQKVQQAISALGYRPSTLARSLVTGRTSTVGIVLPDISNPFFGQAIRGCEDVLYAAGYSIILCNTDEDLEKERRYLDLLIGRQVDALILWGSRAASDTLASWLGDIPMVTVDCAGQPERANATCIDVDNVGGALAATRHLVGRGHRRVAHLAGPSQRLTAQRRLAGYQEALREAGLPYDPALVTEGLPSIRGGYRAAIQLLQAQKPTALFCYNDLMAVGAMVACRHLGLSIPRDLALVGFDDIVLSSLVVPALTTMRIAQYELGKLASELVLERLRAAAMPAKTVLFPVQLQVRNSCGSRRLSKRQMRDILENLVTSIAVDLAPDVPTSNEGGGAG